MNMTAIVNQESHTSGQSKVGVYGWTIVDRPGTFAMIDKYDLNIDRTYQRDQADPKVLSLAASWSWVAFGAILVAKRGEKYFVIDGGHRVLASRRRSDIHALPCIVFECSDVVEEASGFLAANTNRKPMTMRDRFDALLVTKDPAALLIAKLAAEDEREIGTNKNRSIACLARAMKYAKSDANTLEYIWPLVSELVGDAPIDERLLCGLVEIEKRQEEWTLGTARWAKKIYAAGPEKLIRAANEAAAYYARGNPGVWAEGILKILNYRLSDDKKLTMKKDAA